MMDYVEFIKYWHGKCDYEHCPIKQAIADGAPDAEVIAIAEDTDDDIRELWVAYRNDKIIHDL